MNKKVLLLLFALCGVQLVYSKEELISKIFPAADFNGINIDNKYGEVKVENWDKPQIEISVKINIESRKTLTEEKIYSNINVDFHDEGDILSVATEFGRFFSFMKMSNSVFRGGKLAINYLIKAPIDKNLNISMRSGDIVLFERHGNVKIEQQDGTLSCESLYGDNYFMLKGCSAKLTTVNNLQLNMKNGNISIDKVNDLTLDSYDIVATLGELGFLDAKSIRDKLSISKIKGKSTFACNMSAVKVDSLLSDGFFTTNYGMILLKQLGQNFDELKINSKGTDIALGLDKVGVNIAINHHQSTKMEISDKYDLKMIFGEDNKNFISTGYSKVTPANNKLFINCKGGTLVLK